MDWIAVILGYFIGAFPTAYLAARRLKRADIRRMGDGNMGAANAFHELGPAVGIAVGLVDAGKGVLAVLIARALSASELAVLATGLAAVAGHNWPVYLGFRGGRGVSTAIGLFFILVTVPALILTIPSLAVLAASRSTRVTSAFTFILMPVVCWLTGTPPTLIIYCLALAILLGINDLARSLWHARHSQ